MQDNIRDIIEAEIQAIRNIPIDGSMEQAIDLIYEHVHTKSGKLVISGMGKAGQIGHNMGTTFSSTGTPSVFLHPSEAQHGDLGILQQDDLLLLISNSGKTREILELFELARRLDPKIPVIALTGNPESPIGDKANVTIHTGSPKEVCPLGLTPTTSTTVMTIVGDILVVELMKKIGFTKPEYSLRHHSGYLGQKARETRENG